MVTGKNQGHGECQYLRGELHVIENLEANVNLGVVMMSAPVPSRFTKRAAISEMRKRDERIQ